jgi:antitoxin HigA-1
MAMDVRTPYAKSHSIYPMLILRLKEESMTYGNIQKEYNPNHFLDTLMRHLHLHGDQALSKRLRISLKIIKNIRTGDYPIAGSILMCIEEVTGVAVAELRRWMGDRRVKCRLNHRTCLT